MTIRKFTSLAANRHRSAHPEWPLD